uniref:Peptidase_M41 domain-containing protein n=1 Tax=Globodera pallida TaxID=36090 RepID=A0A183C6R6_GLOPA
MLARLFMLIFIVAKIVAVRHAPATPEEIETFEDGIDDAIETNWHNDARTAVHECGHLLIGWMHPDYPNRLRKCTIQLGASDLLGLTSWQPVEMGYTVRELLAHIAVSYGGELAERRFCFRQGSFFVHTKYATQKWLECLHNYKNWAFRS